MTVRILQCRSKTFGDFSGSYPGENGLLRCTHVAQGVSSVQPMVQDGESIANDQGAQEALSQGGGLYPGHPDESLLNTPVAIVGAGPVGLWAAFMCGMEKIPCVVVDSLTFPGGQCQALYPEKPIYDIPGFPSVTGQQLVSALMEQVRPLNPHFLLGHRVESAISCPEDAWLLTTHKGQRIKARAVIVCAGAGSFSPKKPPLPQLDMYEERSVRYNVERIQDFSGKQIVIAGGGDSALDWALNLAPVCAQVHVVHRRAQFRGQEYLLDALSIWRESGRVVIHAPFQLYDLRGAHGALSHVVIQDSAQNTKELEADFLLPFFGIDSDLGPLAAWGLECRHRQVITDPTTGKTNLPNIYAAGDLAYYPNKRKLIVTGFGEAAQAAQSISATLFSHRHKTFQHSTTTGVPSLGGVFGAEDEERPVSGRKAF